jgi:hypothetical protein
MKTVGTLLIAGTADSAVVLSLATQWWLAVCDRCQRAKAAITQRLLPAETTCTFNQRKADAAVATGRCGP